MNEVLNQSSPLLFPFFCLIISGYYVVRCRFLDVLWKQKADVACWDMSVIVGDNAEQCFSPSGTAPDSLIMLSVVLNHVWWCRRPAFEWSESSGFLLSCGLTVTWQKVSLYGFKRG